MPFLLPTCDCKGTLKALWSVLLPVLALAALLPVTTAAAADDGNDNAPLPSRPFSQQLDELNDQQNILERYRLDHLSRQHIEVTLWYTGDYRLDPEEVKAFTNGACFGMLRQAFEAGLRPYRDKTSIVCHARQQDGDAVSAHALGASRYSADDSDEFIFEAE
ncbi:hypothetical protein C7446_2431 [Kushneria sinocarnis]|uniref:Uncharacterized protein n=1 Tax=Kushneria sinocarnis TaxID=595502 RepID=A0A420WUA1_9GAMM|nr:hypothetical protein [Kushneria sinocarnis]RKQ97015.1 hypothetical protein C7446_2431 [Kushneria sinocarnis]